MALLLLDSRKASPKITAIPIRPKNLSPIILF
jgi:hypothetical protein